MIRIELSATALASARFGLSPLMEIGTVLNQWQANRDARWAHAARDTVVRHDLRLLAGFLEHRGYVPDFLNPLPAGYDAEVDDELHAVATAAPEQVAAEVAGWVRGRRRPAARTRPVLDFLERGEDRFARRVADELARFWSDFLSPRWPAVHRRLEADVDRRARISAREGLGAVLGGLDAATRWQDGVLRVSRPFDRDVRETTGLLLLPSTLAGHVGVGVDPLGVRPVHLVYPASATGHDLAGVLGHTRTALLLDLETPRTTAELARRHHLAPSTVSYHLGRLHRAGMVTRTRTGTSVRYHRA